jgi:hypothetical protein
MLKKNPKTEQASLLEDHEWPNVLIHFENMIKPIAVELAAQTDFRDSDLDTLVSNLYVGLEAWFHHLLARKMEGLRVLLRNARHRAAVLQEELSTIDTMAPGLRVDIAGPELTALINLLERDQWLRNYSESTKAHFGDLIEGVCLIADPFYEALVRHLSTSVERKVDKLTRDAMKARSKGDVKRSNELFQQRDALIESAHRPKRGRRRGMLEYPQLHRLVFNLAYAMAWGGITFSAYIKKSARTKVAAGTLIDVLDRLREHLVQQPIWEWLTEYLPLPDEHQCHVATYRRLLKAAREARAET